jgi:hypothetical protein
MAVDPQTVLEEILAGLQQERTTVEAEKLDLQNREDGVVDRIDELDVHIDAIEAAISALP